MQGFWTWWNGQHSTARKEFTVPTDVLGQDWNTFLGAALAFLPRLISGLVLFLVSLGAASVLSKLVGIAVRNQDGPPEVEVLLRRLTKWAIVVLGSIAALQQVDFDVTSFVAGVGVIGFALGFAFQDIAKNFIAGILLLLQQPFGIDEVIRIGDYTGTVADISLRATTIKTFDGLEVVIPNADVYTSTIVNLSTYPVRRRTFTIGLGYEEDIDRARTAFREALGSVPGVMSEPAPRVLCTNLADSWTELTAYYWFTAGEVDLLEMSSGAMQAIKEVAEREGINLPYPIQTVHLVTTDRGESSWNQTK
jgi:small conductance mechanosensitive channel